jgi:hypothetical protein
VPSHDTAQTTSSRNHERDEPPAVQRLDHTHIVDATPSEFRDHKRIVTCNVDSDGETPAQLNRYSATLADGTIVHSSGRSINQSQFEDLVLMVSEIWKQRSDEISSKLSAQNIGIQVWRQTDQDSSLSTKIYDIGIGRGPRTALREEWSLPVKDSTPSTLTSSHVSLRWRESRKSLMKALENHVVSVDRHGSLTTISPPSVHALYSAFENLERIFAYEHWNADSLSASVVLDDSTIVTPAPASVIASNTFLSLATIVWQWWQQEQGLLSEASESITLIRIMYVC